MVFNRLIAFILLVLPVFNLSAQQNFTVVVHGGAGVMSKDKMNNVQQQQYLSKLNEALLLGEKMAKEGSTATDIVVKVINVLEDSPLFNAGKGAVFTHNGKIELDASIMDGESLNAGAVAGARHIRNPITAAREVMQNSDHVLLSGKGASEFARQQGLKMVSNRYFRTPKRHKSLKELKKKERTRNAGDNIGTVGCVVLDIYGNLCAGTSTGGMTNKKFGRIGDSPLIGAGTYANNRTCAVSCTGHGEFFIRLAFARDVSALMEYNNLNIVEACREELNKLDELRGSGGVIGVDNKGNIAMEFNTGGMFRGFVNAKGEKVIAIFKNE
ncbi:MAG: beta-aspartyl-peptidase [Draconibacterium sp.]|nr:MAG: beta-aspartyl-peptidase [Draconibacterium sp.]PIF06157.1 MAG: beta-aspartyl-peptidase [Draconibacterium sp.]